MSLIVNGRSEPLPEPATVAGLLAAQKIAGQRLAVEVNGEIVPRSLWPQAVLTAGDRVEIVRAIGGG